MPFDHFNLIASFYDRAGEFIIGEPLRGLLALSPTDLFLDVGGGTGRVAAALRRMVQEVFVVDVAWGMLRRAAAKDLAVVCSPAESLPFTSESIARVLILDALHHVFDQRLVAHELWRVLAPGGRILVVEPDIHKMSAKLLAIGEKLLMMRSHFLTKEEITSLFSALDLKVTTYNDAFNLFVVAEKVL